ncbi:MAG: hypothetical protein HYW49_13585 [Deltaproteobacteria bacterium]|nr:hypothetical protein [Deltaproteobacteria bacterium]
MKAHAATAALFFLFAGSVDAQTSPQSQTITGERPAAPRASTTLKIQTIGTAKEGGNPTAGDVVALEVIPPSDAQSASPAFAGELEKAPVEWGSGRVLWWKPYDAATGKILVGLTTYAPGPFEIKPIPFVAPSGAPGTAPLGAPVFETEPRSVEFAQVEPKKEEDDVYPPRPVSLPAWVWVAGSLVGLFSALAALWALSRWNRKKRRLEPARPAVPLLSPIEEFEKTRRETDHKKFLDAGRFKPHTFTLSDAAKRFLARAYRIAAEEMTTRELKDALGGLATAGKFSKTLVEQWSAVFDEMDVTKFTDQVPQLDRARDLSARLAALAAATWRASPVARELRDLQQNRPDSTLKPEPEPSP